MNPEQQRRQLALELAISMAALAQPASQDVEAVAKAILNTAQQVDAYLLGRSSAEAEKR